MDYINKFPEQQEGKIICNKAISAFALSLQGESHIDSKTPCQDYSDVLYMEEQGIVLAGIADGVGSCKLSHWGAYIAVNTALEYLASKVRLLSKEKKFALCPDKNTELKTILVDAFREARKAVSLAAEEAKMTVNNFQSTLTVAIYDGLDLVYGHCGDGGIVVQTEAGEVLMLTQRIKGDEASSVYPLQSSEEKWEFGRSAEPISAFTMATDGVLDAYVAKHIDIYGVNYFNGVCYSFMEDAVYGLAKGTAEAAEETLAKYKAYMLSEEYRKAVTDDLTLVTVVSKTLIGSSKHPDFDKEHWDALEKESNRKRQELLWGKKKSKAEPKQAEQTENNEIDAIKTEEDVPQADSTIKTLPEEKAGVVDGEKVTPKKDKIVDTENNSTEATETEKKIPVFGVLAVLLCLAALGWGSYKYVFSKKKDAVKPSTPIVVEKKQEQSGEIKK